MSSLTWTGCGRNRLRSRALIPEQSSSGRRCASPGFQGARVMVQPRFKVVVLFALFVLPALLLYSLFFLYPFAQGIRISFTNWDGLTPRTPISMPKADFESEILGRSASQADRDFLLSIYHLD